VSIGSGPGFIPHSGTNVLYPVSMLPTVAFWWRLDMGISDNEVLNALDIIKTAKTQLRLSVAGNSTRSILITKIKLYNTLLRELRAIHSNLERDMRSRPSKHCSPTLVRSQFANQYIASHQASPTGRSQIQSARAEQK
jgi:hypothetical protein